MLRKYLSKRAAKDIQLATLQAMIAINTGPQGSEYGNKVNSVLKKYVNISLGLEAYEEQDDVRLHEEYERIQSQTPVLSKQDDGSIQVTGIT